MFASMGDSMPPCGVPLYVLLNFHSSTYPALHIFLMTLRNFVSSIFFSNNTMRMLWSMLSKKPSISNSMNHLVPVQYPICLSAVWHDLCILNPFEQSLNAGSYMDSRTMRQTSCTCLSLAVGFPRGRCLPFGFGTYALTTGGGTYLFSLNSSRTFAARSCEYPSMVKPSIPGVIAPLLL